MKLKRSFNLFGVAFGALAFPLLAASIVHAATTKECVDSAGATGCLKTIQAAINAASGTTVVSIHKGTYSENLNIPAKMTIELDGGTTTATDTSITANVGGTPVLTTGAQDMVKLKNLMLGGGSAPKGGGILATGTLSMDNVRVEGNAATSAGAAGGGLRYSAPLGKLTIKNSLFDDDVAVGSGGCLSINGNANISNSRFSGCSSSAADGGAIAITNGNLVLSAVTIDSSTAATNGGGVSVTGGKVTATNTSIVSNTATGSGGGISVAGGSAAMNNCSIGLNSAAMGGGVANTKTANLLKLANTIIAQDSATSSADCMGNLSSSGFNLFQVVTGCTISGKATGDVTGVSPMLNGIACLILTPSECAVLIPMTSAAIDAGNPAAPTGAGSSCLARDALGTKRMKGKCDIGAFEFSFST